MNIIAFILMLIAAVLFLFAPEASGRWGGNRALGLFFLTVGLIVQFTDHARSVTF